MVGGDDALLTAGETAPVTITFSEAVTGFTNGDLVVANGSLTAVGSADGGITYTAAFTPTASIADGTNLITLLNTGIADLAGNVWEWVASSVDKDGVVARGGSYYFSANTARIANRELPEASYRDLTVGFRLCADAP